MTSQLLDEDEQAFKQMLLSAGQAEALPRERSEAAFARFSGNFSALHAGLLGAGALTGSAASASSGWARFVAIAKWVALGAVAGSGVTLLWVEHAATPSGPVAPPVARVVATPEASHGAAPRELPQPVQPAPVAISENRRATRTGGAAQPAAREAKPASDLAAEVAALDAIRTAIAMGAWAETEQQLSRYRAQFPHGALRSEAEVLTLEAMVAQGHQRAAAGAAQRFIAQHPRDPQVARVRALTENPE